MARRIAVLALVLGLLIALPLPLLAAPPEQAGRQVLIGQVDTADWPRVSLYLNVLDAAGRPVEGLLAGSFRVLEDGTEVQAVDFAGLGEQRPVDVVFVLDTTSSMDSYIGGVKQTIVTFAETLAGRNRSYRLALVTFGDKVRQSYSFTDQVAQFVSWVSAQQAEGGGDTPENPWGAAQHAAGLPFRPGVQRLLVLITDAPAHNFGDGPDEDATFTDRNLTLERTVSRLRAESISVYALCTPSAPEFLALAEQTGGQFYSIYDNFTAVVDNLGVALANQYRFTYVSPRPAYDGSTRRVQVTVETVEGAVAYVAPTTRPAHPRYRSGPVELYNALPTPLQISTDPRVVGTNLFVAILVALLFGLTSTVLNDTLNANRDVFDNSRLGRALAALKRAIGAATRRLGTVALPGGRAGAEEATAAAGRRPRIRDIVQVGLFLVVTALIACFLEPSFRFLTWPSVGVFFAMLLSVGLVNMTYEGSQVVAARRFRLDAALRLNPIGILVALGCVLLSRAVGFVPGYLYGVAGGYALGAAADLSRRREAAIGGTALASTLLLALLAWGLTIPTSLLIDAVGDSKLLAGLFGSLQDGLLTIFFVGLEVVFLEMFPLRPTNGAVLFQWSKVVWGAAFGVVGFIALHTLLTPDSAYLDTVRNNSLGLLLGMLALYSALTFGLWYYFERRRLRQAAGVCPNCQQDNGPAARFCARCGTALGAPQKKGRRGLWLIIVLGVLWGLVLLAVVLALLGVG